TEGVCQPLVGAPDLFEQAPPRRVTEERGEPPSRGAHPAATGLGDEELATVALLRVEQYAERIHAGAENGNGEPHGTRSPARGGYRLAPNLEDACLAVDPDAVRRHGTAGARAGQGLRDARDPE